MEAGKISSSIFSGAYEKEGSFDHIAAMALKIYQVPLALIVFTEEEYNLPGTAGLENAAEGKKNKNSKHNSLAIIKDELDFIGHAGDEIFVLANSLVAKGLGWDFFASSPIQNSDGESFGTICLLDRTPRSFSTEDQYFLKCLAAVVADELKKK